LEHAEVLRWPSGVRVGSPWRGGQDIIVPGGSEASWRQWADEASGQVIMEVDVTLRVVIVMQDITGMDVEPPDIWKDHRLSFFEWADQRETLVRRS
jgi:hypothetical protein